DDNAGRFTVFNDNGDRGRFVATKAYETGGIFDTVTTIEDGDGGVERARETVFVAGVGLDTLTGELQIVAPDDATRASVFGTSSASAGVGGPTGPAANSANDLVTVTTDIAGQARQSFAASLVKTVRFVGSDEADFVNLAPTALAAAWFEGRGGNDTLVGANRRDTLEGNAGNDVLFGRNSNDTLDGGGGSDRLFGDFNSSTAGSFDDLLDGGFGNDTVSGGGGNDTVNGGGGADLAVGGAGNDVVNGGRAADILFGDNDAFAPDIVNPDPPIVVSARGGPRGVASPRDPLQEAQSNLTDGNDRLDGGGGSDLIYGQRGRDSLYGGAGQDTLDGGRGADTVDGGAGADFIVYRGGDGRDTVLNFSQNDTFDLRELGRSFIDDASDVVGRARQAGDDVVINLGFDDRIRLEDFRLADLSEDDFLI
ncbi:MAG: calcium-binding protein, partial [Pseudomonadota bacterium]